CRYRWRRRKVRTRSRSTGGPSTKAGSRNSRIPSRLSPRRKSKHSASGTNRSARKRRNDADVQERAGAARPAIGNSRVIPGERLRARPGIQFRRQRRCCKLGPGLSRDDADMKHDFQVLKLDHVTRRFAGAGGKAFNALDELTMIIKRGEFIALLGPSGCGKSTALNCIAGLLPLSGGTIWLDEMRIDTLPPERRGFGMVFQNYALFPHMSVAKNIGFGLRMRRVGSAEVSSRVGRALKLVQLIGLPCKLCVR